MAGTFNIASADSSINLMHPFKLELKSSNQQDSEGRPKYQISLNWHSKLYTGFKSAQNGGDQFLTFEKIKISNLKLSSLPINCLIKIFSKCFKFKKFLNKLLFNNLS